MDYGLQTLNTHLSDIIFQLEIEAPKLIADKMVDQTKSNFSNQAYMNNGVVEKWEDRYYDNHLTPRGIFLQHNKLNRTGRLKRSIKAKHSKSKASIETSVGYAEKHNEGYTGAMWYKDSYYGINRPIRSLPKRKFMGVGEKDYKNALFVYQLIFGKYF